MDTARKRLLAGLVGGVVATLVALFLIALLVAYGGIYDIGASSGHTSGVRWLTDSAMRSSVQARAPDDPDQAPGPQEIAAGAREYKAMCEHCHGGPGTEPAGWSRGMLPRPPHLTEAAAEWETGEVFWIASNGLKFTGMPSFGQDHDDATLWNIASFVTRLPGMTQEQYDAYGTAHSHGGGDSGAGHHGQEQDGQENHGQEPHGEARP